MKPLTVFLDANVLYSAGLRDLFMRLALQNLFQIKWSERVHKEWMRNLLANRPDLRREQLQRTYQLMLQFAPNSLVEGYEAQIDHLTLPDPEDRHVLAAAITGHADLIITFNLSDFPDKMLAQYGIKAWHPDRFICHLLDRQPQQVHTAIRQHRVALKNPAKTLQEYLDEREKDGLSESVARFREMKSFLLDSSSGESS